MRAEVRANETIWIIAEDYTDHIQLKTALEKMEPCPGCQQISKIKFDLSTYIKIQEGKSFT